MSVDMYQTKPTRTSICEHRNSGLVHGLTFSCVKTNNICIARLMMRKQKLNMNFQYTALNMNYSVAGFQVDCLVTNFPKGLLVAIYAGKSISSASEDERGHFALKYHLFFWCSCCPDICSANKAAIDCLRALFVIRSFTPTSFYSVDLFANIYPLSQKTTCWSSTALLE